MTSGAIVKINNGYILGADSYVTDGSSTRKISCLTDRIFFVSVGWWWAPAALRKGIRDEPVRYLDNFAAGEI